MILIVVNLFNINKCKEGDLITRIEPNKNPNGDRSYMNDKIWLVGVEKGIIFLVREDYGGGYSADKLSEDWWGEGWDYYPTTMWQKAKT